MCASSLWINIRKRKRYSYRAKRAETSDIVFIIEMVVVDVILEFCGSKKTYKMVRTAKIL
jgi:hypothetical protein